MKKFKAAVNNNYVQELKGNDGSNEWTDGKYQQRNESCKNQMNIPELKTAIIRNAKFTDWVS